LEREKTVKALQHCSIASRTGTMSWPSDGDPASGSPAQDDQHQPITIASLGTFDPNGHLVSFTRENQEQALRLLTVPFESLPRLPAFAPLFGYTTEWQKNRVALTLAEMSGGAQRVVMPLEAEAIAFHASKRCSKMTWIPPTTLAIAAYFTQAGRTTFRFPFYTPGASFSPTYFPSRSMPFLKGTPAARAWHVVRFGAYGTLSYIMVRGFIYSFAQSSFVVGILKDERLHTLRESVFAKRREQLEKGGVPMGASRRGADNEAQGTSAQRWQPRVGQVQAQTPRAAPPPQDAPQGDDLFLFDDASPVAPSQQQPSPRPSGTTTSASSEGSAWERIRQQARAEASVWNRGDQQDGEAPGGRRRTEQYTYVPGEQKTATAREQAQREFDAMLERERRGEGNGGGRM
jgi:hypothetical protein